MATRSAFGWALAGLVGLALQTAHAATPAAQQQAPTGPPDPAVGARVVSPVDTLHMSILEKAFWSRHGLMRVTGLFRLDQDNPRNDFRQLAKVRRKMLSCHQMLGLATVASMAVTVYGGQRAINGNGSGLHTASLPVAIGLYSTTAALALASPPKLVPERRGVDTIDFHKGFAALHLAGMLITPMIAPDGADGKGARRHQVTGYSTFGAFTAGMLVVTVFN